MENRNVKIITQSHNRLANECFSTNDCSSSALAVCSSYGASRCPAAASYCMSKGIDEMEANRKEQACAWAGSAKQCCYGQMRTARSSGTSSCRSTTKHCNNVGMDVLAVVDHLHASFGDATSGRATLIAQVLTGIDPTVPTTHWLECNSSDVRCTCSWRAQRCRLVSRKCDKTDGVAWAAHMHHCNNELRICQQHMKCDLQSLCFKESNRLVGAGGKEWK